MAPAVADDKPLVALPENAPRPPFVWSASLPTTWRIIDLDPSRMDSNIANLLRDDDLVPGVRLSSAQRRAMQQSLKDMATQAREAGVLLALVQPGVDDGEISVVPLLLRWADSTPVPASVLSAQKQVGSKADTSVEPTRSGESFLLACTEGQAGPLTQRRTVYHHQAFVPIASSTWTLTVSSTAPSESVSSEVRDIVARVAASVMGHTEITASTTILSDAVEHEKGVETEENNEVEKPGAGLSRVWVRGEGVYNHAE